MLSRRAWFRNLLAAPVGVYAVMKGIAAPKPLSKMAGMCSYRFKWVSLPNPPPTTFIRRYVD